MTIIVCAPHPDDEMLGMGGTIAKLSAAGERVVVVIFTLGESSHPWQRRATINKTRKQEATDANRIAGTAEVIFLELNDLAIGTEVVEKNMSERFARLIEEEKPRALFTTAIDDVHADHQSVARFVIYVGKKHNIPVWMYTVWNPLHIVRRGEPRLVVDITPYFRKKWRAIQAYKSQKVSTFQLIPTVMLRGFFNGLRYKKHMAEVFVRAT